jgi:hypothetical protein
MAEIGNEALYVAIGLKPEADIETATKVAADHAHAVRQLLAITKTATTADLVGVVMANASAAERYQAAEAKVIAGEKEQREGQFDALLKQGDLDGKLPPALAKSEWIQEMRKSPTGVATLKSFLERAPVLISRKPILEESDEAANIELSHAEISAAKQFVGDDTLALKSRLDALRAQKLEDIRTRKAASR